MNKYIKQLLNASFILLLIANQHFYGAEKSTTSDEQQRLELERECLLIKIEDQIKIKKESFNALYERKISIKKALENNISQSLFDEYHEINPALSRLEKELSFLRRIRYEKQSKEWHVMMNQKQFAAYIYALRDTFVATACYVVGLKILECMDINRFIKSTFF